MAADRDGPEHGGQGGEESEDAAAAGEAVFAANCSGCHGALGTGGNGGPDLSNVTDQQAAITQITDGGGGMPAFGDQLSEQQIANVAAFVTFEAAGRRQGMLDTGTFEEER